MYAESQEKFYKVKIMDSAFHKSKR